VRGGGGGAGSESEWWKAGGADGDLDAADAMAEADRELARRLAAEVSAGMERRGAARMRGTFASCLRCDWDARPV
jgi:hypothetical protein